MPWDGNEGKRMAGVPHSEKSAGFHSSGLPIKTIRHIRNIRCCFFRLQRRNLLHRIHVKDWIYLWVCRTSQPCTSHDEVFTFSKSFINFTICHWKPIEWHAASLPPYYHFCKECIISRPTFFTFLSNFNKCKKKIPLCPFPFLPFPCMRKISKVAKYILKVSKKISKVGKINFKLSKFCGLPISYNILSCRSSNFLRSATPWATLYPLLHRR